MSTMINKSFEVFSFSELSANAKDKVLQSERGDFDFTFHAECVIDDFKEICSLIGIDVDKVYYSGFCSQGDGASFTGDAAYKKGAMKAIKDYAPQDKALHAIVQRWVNFNKTTFYKLSCDITQSGNYYHQYTMRFEWNDYSDREDGQEILQDLAGWLYKQLEKSYDFCMSDENLIEDIELNDCKFLECGTPFYG